jgi:hypothetical protein
MLDQRPGVGHIDSKSLDFLKGCFDPYHPLSNAASIAPRR